MFAESHGAGGRGLILVCALPGPDGLIPRLWGDPSIVFHCQIGPPALVGAASTPFSGGAESPPPHEW